jgi:hypoxia up-regulated 1
VVILVHPKSKKKYSEYPKSTSILSHAFLEYGLIFKFCFRRSELGKSLNTDEAPALGAVYQAAYQSKGYKVKKFYLKDLNVYPIVVDFEKFYAEGEERDSDNTKVRRVLFDKYNNYPQRKVMTFSKHTKDFGFNVNYGDLSFLNTELIR